MKARLFYISGLIVLLLAACSQAAQPRLSIPGAPASKPADSYQSNSAAGSTAAQPAQEATTGYAAGVNAAEVKRIVIKNASLSIAVDDPAASMDRISKMADEVGGFVVTARQYQSQLSSGAKVPQASITIRVPAERLNEALSRIKAETKRPVISENLDSQDVTSDYTDLQSRLRNLEAAEAQLKEIMGSAQKTEDVLNVYNQLTQVREQIEVIKGKIQYYDESASLSAISVELLTNEAVQPLTIGGWQPVGVARDALQATINSLKFLASAAIWIVLFLIPVLFFIILPVYLLFLLVRALRRRSRGKMIPPAPAV